MDASHRDGSQGSSSAADAGGPSSDAHADAPGSALGDRDLGIDEPYLPADYLLVQNGGRFIDVRNPPAGITAAVGDGVHDDTQAFLDVFNYLRDQLVNVTFADPHRGCYPTNCYAAFNYWVYIPNGTYNVSQTLTYTGESLQQLNQETYGDAGLGPWFDLVHLRIVGESREGTIIKLADKSPDFQDLSHPAPVLAVQKPTTSSSSGTTFNDIPADNLVKNLTIDTGSQNPAAVGLLMQGANVSGLRNVLVRSGDGLGHAGIWLPIQVVQGCYHDLTVEGFDYGISQEGTTTNGCFEHVTLTGQNVAGVLNATGNLTLRSVSMDESAHGASGVVMNGIAAQTLVVDAVITGGSGANTVAVADNNGTHGSLFLRHVETPGYGAAVAVDGVTTVTGSTVGEYVWPDVVSVAGDGGTSLDLPIDDAPLPFWGSPASDWANIEDYRQGTETADGGPNDDQALENAIASGKSVIVFPHTSYSFHKTASVRASVKRLDFLYAEANLTLTVSEPSAEPLTVENAGSQYGLVVVKSQAARDVYMREGGMAYENADKGSIASRVFIDDGAYTVDEGPGQSVWARGADSEQAKAPNVEMKTNGGTVWIMGYKNEGNATVLQATNGSTVEVLGGYTYIYDDTAPWHLPWVDNQGSRVSMSGVIYADPGFFFFPAIRETSSAGTVSLPSDDASGGPGCTPDGGQGGTDDQCPLEPGGACTGANKSPSECCVGTAAAATCVSLPSPPWPTAIFPLMNSTVHKLSFVVPLYVGSP